MLFECDRGYSYCYLYPFLTAATRCWAQSTVIHEYGSPEDAYAFGVILWQLMTRQVRSMFILFQLSNALLRAWTLAEVSGCPASSFLLPCPNLGVTC